LDYNEVFAPVSRLEIVRLIVAAASNRNWSLYQLDVKSTFLNGPLEEEVYITQPPGYVEAGQKDKVYKLNKALYGLNQTPRAWNMRIDSFLVQQNFTKSTTEHGVYVRNTDSGEFLIICLYVDYLLVTNSSKEDMRVFKGRIMEEFEMSDLGELSYFLGIEFVSTSKGIFMHKKSMQKTF